MRFYLVDRITELEAGKRLRGVKNLTLGEEYLADHFPSFPVMPGVLMLHTLVEAAAWLLRLSSDYQFSVITLEEARGVKYGHFMEPGRSMEVTVELLEQPDAAHATFKGKGECDGHTTVSGRFSLVCSNLADRDASWRAADDRIRDQLRSHARVLCGAGRAPQA